MSYDLDAAVRRIPDFPKPGILFYDVTGILLRPEAFAWCTRELSAACAPYAPQALAAVEARGFVFGAPVAGALGLPLILIRKKGKLPGEKVTRSFELEYGTDVIEVHKADIPAGGSVVLIDDLVATGGTLKAACELFRENGCRVEAVVAVIGLPFLHYERTLQGVPVKTLIQYHGE